MLINEDLIEEFNKEYSRVNPQDYYILYFDSMWKVYEIRHSDLRRDSRYEYVIKPLENLMGCEIDYQLWESTHTRLRPDRFFEDNLKKAIKKLKRKSPAKMQVQKGKQYECLKDFYMGRMQFKKGLIFEVIYNGTGWDNHTLVKVKSGLLRPTKYSSKSGTSPVGNFISLEEMSAKYEINMCDIELGFDPYNGGYLSVKEVV